MRLEPLSLPLRGNVLIEASAGTGKTYTLSLLYVRFILGHGTPPLLPPQILVMTYTNAATEELRERLHLRLLEAVRGFRQPEAKCEDWLNRLRQDYSEQEFAACARKLELAAQLMDQAAISSIHSWCQRMLREHTFAASSPLQQDIDPNQGQRQNQVIKDYWRVHYAPQPENIAEKLPPCLQTPEQLATQLGPLLGKQNLLTDMPQANPLVTLGDWLEKSSTGLKQLKTNWAGWVQEARDTFANWYEQHTYDKQKLKKNHLENIWKELEDWLNTPEQHRPDINFSSATWQRLSCTGMREIWNQAAPCPNIAFFEAASQLENELAGLELNIPPLLVHAIQWVNKRLREEKEQHGLISYDDLLLYLQQALTGEKGQKLAAAIRQQFPVALIDEFQDTDPVQYAIFNAIYDLSTRDGKGCVILIGDPKQAIYAFRGADIFTYLRARTTLQNSLFSLTTNYRSSPAMVQAVNDFFAHAEQHAPEGAFGFGTSLPFQPVDSRGGMEEQFVFEGRIHPPVTVWWTDDEKMGQGKYRKNMAEQCARQITRLLHAGQSGRAVFVTPETKRPVTTQDMAILVNSASEAAIIQAALSDFGVASVYLSERDSVFASPVCQELLTILRAVEQPQEKRCRQALATPLLAVSLAEQAASLTDQATWEKWQTRFLDYRRCWQQQGILVLVSTLIHDFHIASRLLTEKKGERHLTDLLHLGELLQTLDRQGMASLLQVFQLNMQEKPLLGDTARQRLESDHNCVRIITVHKAKGLEYPLVFFPFPVLTPQKTNFPLTIHDENGRQQLYFTGDATRLAAAQKESRGEELRKFYVAMTRSRHALWLGLGSTKMFAASSMGYFFSGSDEKKNLRTILSSFSGVQLCPQENGKPQPWQEQQTQNLQPARKPPVFSFENWQISSYSSLTGTLEEQEDSTRQPLEEKLTELAGIEPGRISGQDQLSGLELLPPGPQTGTLLHKLLEAAAAWPAPSPSKTNGFLACLQDTKGRKEYLRAQARFFGHPELAATLESWLKNILSTPLEFGNDRLLLSELHPSDMQTEMEFLLSINHAGLGELDRIISQNTTGGKNRPLLRAQTVNGMLRGFIDLVVQIHGRYFIIDWKSNWLGNGVEAYSREKLIQEIHAHRYDVQYSLYLLALHRLLRARLENYCWDTHVGGAAYVFLRGGPAVFWEKPPREMIEELDSRFQNSPNGQ